MRVDLLVNQKLLSDHDLLVFAVAGEFEGLHSIPKRRRNGIEHVRSSDKHHLRQIVGDIDIVIGEGKVLLWIQYLQECRRRVTPKVHSDLIHFIQHENRVVRSCFFDSLNDPAWEGAHIGSSMTSDLSFISAPTQWDRKER